MGGGVASGFGRIPASSPGLLPPPPPVPAVAPPPAPALSPVPALPTLVAPTVSPEPALVDDAGPRSLPGDLLSRGPQAQINAAKNGSDDFHLGRFESPILVTSRAPSDAPCIRRTEW